MYEIPPSLGCPNFVYYAACLLSFLPCPIPGRHLLEFFVLRGLGLNGEMSSRRLGGVCWNGLDALDYATSSCCILAG